MSSESVALGDTFPLAGRSVHRVGFGAMQLPGPGVMGPPRDHDQAVAVLRRAVERGVNHIDTAQFYGPDVSNELIREALQPLPPTTWLWSPRSVPVATPGATSYRRRAPTNSARTWKPTWPVSAWTGWPR